MNRTKWTDNDFLLAMNLYTKLRYGQFNYNNPDVINLANLIEKSPGAVAFKLVHLSRSDPEHRERVKGLTNPGKNAVEMYNRFVNNWDEMLYQSEVLLASYQNKRVEDLITEKYDVLDMLNGKEGINIENIVKTRVNQSLFRKVVLNNYYSSCTVCGLNIESLLVASHILKWSESSKERLNPTNGLCLCNIHDKAFENGYIGIMENYQIVI